MLEAETRARLKSGIAKHSRHIFRDAEGHLAEDTPENRQLFVDVVMAPAHYLGADKYGTDWYAKTLPSGEQLWVQVRKGEIRNAGKNPIPKRWTAATGLAGLL